MNYGKLYKKFCFGFKKMKRNNNTGKFTEHHIHLRSMGGPDIEENKVLLTPREHYIAHRILAKKYQKRYPEIYYLLNTFANGMKGPNGVRYCDFHFYWKKYVTLKNMGSKDKTVQEALKLAQEETMRLLKLPSADVDFIMLKVMSYTTGKDYITCNATKKE